MRAHSVSCETARINFGGQAMVDRCGCCGHVRKFDQWIEMPEEMRRLLDAGELTARDKRCPRCESLGYVICHDGKIADGDYRGVRVL